MRKILQLAGFIGVFAFGTLNAQTYLTENFDGVFSGNPAAPAGWSQTRTILLGDGIPEATLINGEKDWEQNTNTGLATWSLAPGGTYPNAAVSGSTALFMNDYYFGSTGNAFGSRRMESPNVNLSLSTNPYVRFWYFCGYSSTSMLLRVVASNDGGATWKPIMVIAPNADVATFASTTPYQRINVKIPAAFKVSQAKFALEMTNTWGVQTLFIDDFSVEEFTPTTITSATSGGWSNPATWVGGIVPNANNNVVIAATHTVQTDINIARMQNVTVDGVFQYSTTLTTQLNHIFGDITVSASGQYFSGNGIVGKRTYFGGNLINNGIINFQPGTSITGAIVWCGYSSTYSGSGAITNNRVPIVVHAASSGVQYSNPFTISNTCALYTGTVNATNLTLGNPPAAAVFLTERLEGKFVNTPTFNNTNVTQRNLTFTNPVNGQGGLCLGLPQVTVTPGTEVEVISGLNQVAGVLTMNTHNNLVLTSPLSVGTATGTQNISLTRGIITTTTLNLLTLNPSATGVVGTIPTTITSTGINGGNQGSYVNGPVKINFPSLGSGNRTFPLGVGNAFHTNLPSANARREIVLGSGALAWTSQTITATIENAPTGPVTGTLTTVMGNRAYRLNTNGGPGLGVNNTVQLAYNNSSFGGNDNLIGTFQEIRLVQSPGLNGPWSERSLTAGTGPITGDTPGTRITTSLTPGPINNGNQYFGWGTTAGVLDLAASSLSSPGTVGCYGPNQTVSYVITNTGIAPINFVTNNATITSSVAGAASQVFAPVLINTGVLLVGASQTVVVTTTLNMSALGTYSFYSTVSTSGDLNLTNDVMTVATRTLIAALPLPYSQDFNAALTLPAGFTNAGSPLYNVLANHGNLYTDNALAGNLYGSTQTISIVTTPKLGAVNALSVLSYDYRIQDWSAYPSSAATTTLNWANDSLNVYVSTNCGITYTMVQSNNAANHTPSTSMLTRTVNLGAYVGNDVIVRFVAKKAPAGTGDYYPDLDNINITAPIAVDAGAIALSAPGLVGCYSSTEPVSITIKNHGINALTNIPVTVVVSGVVNQTLNATYTGTLVSTATVNFVVGNINMLVTGTYSFDAFTSMAGDGQPANDAMAQATRTVIAALPLPYSQNFNAALTLPAGFTNAGSPAYSVFSNHGNTYTDNALSGNLYGTTQTISIVNLPKLGAVAANTTLKYDYRIQDWSGYPASAATTTLNWANDSLNVYVSTNCGLTYTLVQSNNASNHNPSATLVTKTVNLGSFAGNDVIIRFIAKKAPAGTGDYYADLDNINICSAPVAPVASGSGVCSGNTATLTTVATGTAQWYATPTSTAFIASGNTFVTPILTANTTYYLLDSTACSLSTLTPVTITVAALPTLVISASQASVCLGGTLNIGVTGATSYTWSTGSNSASIAPTVTATTNYSVIGINAPGCSSTSSVSITGLAQPTVSVVSSTSLICVGGTASLTASGATSYTWSTGANGASIALTVTATTNYSVIGEIAPGCSSTSSVSITGLANPTVSVVSSTSIICVGGTASLTASGASTYSWNTSSTNTVIAISPTVNTTYTVTGTSSNSCKNIATITQSVSACTGLNNNGASTIGALVYPNPNTGLFTIELNNGSVKTIEVMDLTGRIVLTNTSSNDKIDFNISNLANGVYFVKVQSNNTVEVIKIVKQ